ncbi:MAG: class I adenylate-forming enzyme family protein [Acidimicrobiales bacterium]
MAAIDGWVAYWADQRPNHTAIEFEGREIGYRRLHDQVLAMAKLLVGKGVERGDRVAFCGLNRPEQIVALFACGRIGAVLLPLNNRLSIGEHRFQLADAEPRLALVTDGFDRAIGDADPSLEIIDLDGEPAGFEPALDDVDRPARPSVNGGPSRPPSVGGPDDPVLMVYTSGTTGRPKGAVHSQSSLLHTVLNGVAHQDLSADDRILTVLPLFHVGGLNIQTLPALYVGATVHIQRRFDPGRCLAAIAEHRPTQTLFVPAVMDAVLGHPDVDDVDFSCLRGLNSGSSVVPDHLIRGFLDRGVPVGQVYGSTETGPTALVLRYEDGADNVGSCGKPALHTELRLADPDGRAVIPGAAGEVLVSGPNLFVEYWRQPEATAAAFTGRWYRTGDVARQDERGFVHIEDRVGDVLISGGENVYPAEVENVVGQHPGVAQVAVIGRADERWGQIPVAVIETSADGSPPTVGELRDWCRDRLARFKQPRAVVVVDELPRTALGKVTKHVLRERFG